jgi:hypothetical protein
MLDGFPRVLPDSHADAADREDPREALIRELDRIADGQTYEQSRALAGSG